VIFILDVLYFQFAQHVEVWKWISHLVIDVHHWPWIIKRFSTKTLANTSCALNHIESTQHGMEVWKQYGESLLRGLTIYLGRQWIWSISFCPYFLFYLKLACIYMTPIQI
jgi:hypothetical protein